MNGDRLVDKWLKHLTVETIACMPCTVRVPVPIHVSHTLLPTEHMPVGCEVK